MLIAGLAVLLAFGLSAFTYLGLERLGRRAWVALLCRALAWTALGLLLVNLSCPARGAPLRPLVLLDASLSLGAAGGHWREARDSALRWGEILSFGDERLSSDTAPTRGRSLLAPALIAASASDRPVIIVSDGEIEDGREIPADILARSGVRLFPRDQRADLAISLVSGPSRVSAGDSIPLELQVEASGGETRDTVAVEVVSGTTRLAKRIVRLKGKAAGRARIVVPSAGLSPGDHVLRVRLVQSGDAEPRTDTRLHLVTVAATPGVVFLAGPADWDSRFLYQTLREVGQLPVRGYVRLEGNRWRSMTDLRAVPAEQVRRAARRADLLVLKGGVGGLAEGSRARGIWRWPSGEGGEVQVPGDWYLIAADDSPVAGAFLGQPVDSFPPAIQLTPMQPAPRDWVALYAQLGRRGPQRPAVFGRQDGRTREVGVAADGLWRWAFRGGASEQSYRSWVAATASWLLGGADSARGLARPIEPVVANGRPVIFEWVGNGSATPQIVSWSGEAGQGVDTLHFDGDGRAPVWLQPGDYRYRLGSGGGGTVAVERYSDELIPHPVTLTAHKARATGSSTRTSARDWIWLFGICVLALSGEWFARRRLGLR
ncbi:MAG TPA: hypothetical protein VGJ36_08260 [Gemmatimonadales bacterium]|jgi:hypothetical protein